MNSSPQAPSLLLRTLAYLLLVSALALFLINIYGELRGPLPETVETETTAIPGRHTRTVSVARARQAFKELRTSMLSPEEKARKLFELVSGSYLHLPSYQRDVWDNWYVWLRGLRGESFLRTIQDADLLWRRGGGFCSQASIIFASKAQELGLPARIVLLGKHVAAEVFIEGKGPRIVDTDLGVFWDYSLADFGKQIRREDIIRELEKVGHPTAYAEEAADFYLSEDDNLIVDFPLDTERLRFERSSELYKWLFPALFLFISLSVILWDQMAKSRQA